MKKSIYMAFVAVLTIIVITSCNNTNPPTDPAKGGTYLIGEVYDLVGLTVDKAIARLEGKGYVLDEEEENEYYELLFRFNNGKEKYQIGILTTNDVVVNVTGETKSNFKEFQEWHKWLVKKFSSYDFWYGFIDEQDYYDVIYELDGPYPTKSDFDKTFNKFTSVNDFQWVAENYINEKGFSLLIEITDREEEMWCEASQDAFDTYSASKVLKKK